MASNKKLERQTANDFLADVAEAPPSPESLVAQAAALQRQAVSMQAEAQRLATARAEAEQAERTRVQRETLGAALSRIAALDAERLQIVRNELAPLIKKLSTIHAQINQADYELGQQGASQFAFSGGSSFAAASGAARERAGLAPGIFEVTGFKPETEVERAARHVLTVLLKFGR